MSLDLSLLGPMSDAMTAAGKAAAFNGPVSSRFMESYPVNVPQALVSTWQQITGIPVRNANAYWCIASTSYFNTGEYVQLGVGPNASSVTPVTAILMGSQRGTRTPNRVIFPQNLNLYWRQTPGASAFSSAKTAYVMLAEVIL